MNLFLISNSEVGISGYGLRVGAILEQLNKKDRAASVYCKNFKYNRVNKYHYLFPLSKLISLAIEIFRYSGFGFANKLFVGYYNLIDKRLQFKIKTTDLVHTWEDLPKTLEKAKNRGSIIIKDCSMINPEGATKLHPFLFGKFKMQLGENEKRVIALTDFFIAPSVFVKESLVAYGIENERIFVCSFGVDLDQFKPMNKQRKNKFRILFVGVIRERKNLELLLEAINQLNNNDIEVVLCGRIHSSSKRLVNYYKDKINLSNLGFVNHKDLPFIYNSADIFVFPSLIEGSAKVTYEAMACGLPVITTHFAGSVVEDGKEGFIVGPDNIYEMKEKISFFYNNGGKIFEMGENARKKIENYSWANYGDRVIEIYDNIIRMVKNESEKN